MDQEMRDKINNMESSVRHQMAYYMVLTHDAAVLVDGQELLDIFAAFRLEIIKAGGRNA